MIHTTLSERPKRKKTATEIFVLSRTPSKKSSKPKAKDDGPNPFA